MTTRRTLALIISTMAMTSGVAQEKLTEEEIKSTAQQIKKMTGDMVPIMSSVWKINEPSRLSSHPRTSKRR